MISKGSATPTRQGTLRSHNRTPQRTTTQASNPSNDVFKTYSSSSPNNSLRQNIEEKELMKAYLRLRPTAVPLTQPTYKTTTNNNNNNIAPYLQLIDDNEVCMTPPEIQMLIVHETVHLKDIDSLKFLKKISLSRIFLIIQRYH
ncbi:unnamed protein product [Cunninghamella echinulata]